jgi:hypothetical protein
MTIPYVTLYIKTHTHIYISFIDRTINNVTEISRNFFYGHSVFQSLALLLSIYSAFDVLGDLCQRQKRQKEFSQIMTCFIQ